MMIIMVVTIEEVVDDSVILSRACVVIAPPPVGFRVGGPTDPLGSNRPARQIRKSQPLLLGWLFERSREVSNNWV